MKNNKLTMLTLHTIISIAFNVYYPENLRISDLKTNTNQSKHNVVSHVGINFSKNNFPTRHVQVNCSEYLGHVFT